MGLSIDQTLDIDYWSRKGEKKLETLLSEEGWSHNHGVGLKYLLDILARTKLNFSFSKRRIPSQQQNHSRTTSSTYRGVQTTKILNSWKQDTGLLKKSYKLFQLPNEPWIGNTFDRGNGSKELPMKFAFAISQNALT